MSEKINQKLDVSLVSVIMPTYNSAKFIGAAIESVINQTYSNFELIIIDDGSTDNTKEIIESYNDSRIFYFYQDNMDKAIARNNGIKKASGKFICFLDSDDYYFPNKLTDQLTFLKNRPGIDLVVGNYIRVDETDVLIRKNELNPNKFIGLKPFLFGNPFPIHSSLIRSEYVKKIGGFDEKLKGGEDWDFHFRLALKGCKMEMIDTIVCAYRFQKNAVTKTNELYCKRMVEIVNNFFLNSSLQSNMKRNEAEAKARVHYRLAARCLVADQIELGFQYLLKALKYDSNRDSCSFSKINYALIFWINHLQIKQRIKQLNNIYENLPPEIREMNRSKKYVYYRVRVDVFVSKIRNKSIYSIISSGASLLRCHFWYLIKDALLFIPKRLFAKMI